MYTPAADSIKIKSKRPELQFFGSTVDRDVQELVGNTETAKNVNLAPGMYDRSKIRSEKGARKSANFLGGKRPDNLFSVVENTPGPTDYNTSMSVPDFKGKFWSSSVEAFGNTLKRFPKQS